MVIQHVIAAMNADRQFKISTGVKSKSAEKLSSGYRINRAADDAAGLAISEKMRRTIRGLMQGTENLMDGISLCQVADGALNEVHDILNRINELSVKGGNDTLTSADRSYIQAEVDQLVDGLDDVFLNTEFNENYIFRAPYVPNVTGNPNDFQVFNSYTGTPGGLLINHKRYTFNELGMNVRDDGTFAKNDVEITLDGGEKLEVHTEAGAALNEIHRTYRWTADETGIYVNDVRAATWADLGLHDGSAAGTYSFDYHGMNVSFTAEEDDLRLVIAGINGDGISNVSWETTTPMAEEGSAVNMAYAGTFNITNANKDNVHGEGDTYTVHADSEGIWIHDDLHGNNTTKVGWANLQLRTGQYPITDWGLPNEQGDEVTLDYDEGYYYIGNLSSTDFFNHPIELWIKIMDEASLESVISGIDGQQFTIKNEAELTGTAGGDSVVTANLSFEFQRDNGRDFDAASGGNAFFGNTFEITPAEDALEHHDGTGEDDPGYDILNGTVSITIGDKTFTSGELHGDTRVQNYISDVTLYLDDNPEESITIDKYYFADPNTSIELQATDKKPKQSMTVHSADSNDVSITYGIKVNAPEKALIIQAGADAGDTIEMKWKPLNSSILGIGGLLYSSAEASSANIDAVKAAQAIISEERTIFGTYQNRFEHAVRNNENITENTQNAESIIRDTDMAAEMQRFSNASIIAEAGQAMLAQANQTNQGVMNLLQ